MARTPRGAAVGQYVAAWQEPDRTTVTCAWPGGLSPHGAVTLDGVDVGQIDDAGLLRRMVGFFGPLPPRRPGR